MAGLTKAKARMMLRENRARGKRLTPAQRGYFGLVAGGGKPTRLRARAKKRRR